MDILDRFRRHPAYWYVVAGLNGLVALVLVFQVGRLEQNYAYDSPGTYDFIEYWSAGQLLRQGENPYDFEKLHVLQKKLGSTWKTPIIMWNPPWLLVWIYPLLLLPFPTAALVWLAANGGLLLLSGSLTWRIVSSPTGRLLGVGLLATGLFVPSILTLVMGQMSALILFGMAGFYYFACRNRDLPAGMCLAVASIKPHVAYLVWLAVIWWVIAGRRWRVVIGGALVLLPTLAVLTLLWRDWLHAYQAAMANPPLYWATPTLGYFVRLLVFQHWPQAQFLPMVVGTVCLLAYALLWRPPIEWKADLGPLLLLSVPTAAYGWTFDQVILLIPFLTIIFWLIEPGKLGMKQRFVVMVGLLLIVAGTAVQNINRLTEEAYFWCPLALGAVYLYIWHARRPRPKTQFA